MNTPPLALIGGEGKMPFLIMEGALAANKEVFLLAINDVTSPELAKMATDVVWISFTQVGKAIKECHKRGVKELVMGGRVSHVNVFSLSLFNIDMKTLKLFKSLPDKRADTLLKALGDLLAEEGITVVNSVEFLSKYLAKEGVLTDKTPSQEILEDIQFGSKLAKEMGGLDIGQTVVVKKGVVVAVEALEGTDRCLERAGKLAGEGCVVVKTAKPNQDMRFDVPVIGINTIEKLSKIKASAMAIEANKTLIIDEDLIPTANKLGLTLYAIH